tara:strand:- start:23673 stop:24275 length:603 start_codon:yes stop_codon:yes gene_type:complete
MKIDVDPKQLLKTIQVFQDYGKQVRRYARMILSQRKKNTKSKQLYNSIAYEVNTSGNTVSVKISMDEYGKFVDQGVAGSKSSYPGVGKTKDILGIEENFGFKGLNIKEGVVESWIANKPIKLRELKGSSKGGQYKSKTKPNIKSASYLIGRAIATRGLPYTGFLSKPIITQGKNLENNLWNAFGEDIGDNLDKVLNLNFK